VANGGSGKRRTERRRDSRSERLSSASIGPWKGGTPSYRGKRLTRNAVVDCGWGSLIFAHTFEDNDALVKAVVAEEPGRRNLALYLRDPHVVLSLAPHELFLDPSHTYRLWMSRYAAGRVLPQGFLIRRLQRRTDADDVYRLLMGRGMVSAEPQFIWKERGSKVVQYFVAVDPDSERVIGTVTGIDHGEAFADPENGSSMWCLAVDPQARYPGIGRALVAYAADHFAARGRAFMDLSVMHDNEAVIRLYEDLGFERVAAFCVKKRNAINQPLYIGRRPAAGLNIYAQIIVDEALKRGIAVDVLDAEEGYFALQYGGRRIICRESLSELTSAVAMSRCDNKRVTHRVLADAGLAVPRQRLAGEGAANEAFLAECGRLVVKPARGEQGDGISVNIGSHDELEAAIGTARRFCRDVVLEEYVEGEDLRIVVIDYRVAAAAVRRPAAVVGTGRHAIAELIDKQSRRRAAATGGESRIPVDDETRRCLARRGYALDDVLAEGEEVRVRETANLHTGGTLHDVTEELSPRIRAAAEQAARVLAIPVVGLDLLVDAADGDRHVFIEANERPGLANHEPQPTAERFVDLLFPQTAGG
jgi:GNAT-family acetyltransferase (TIGR03103 family)